MKDEKPSCNHEWEFRKSEKIGHSMAFCKKCGYLRGSRPSCEYYNKDYCTPCKHPDKYFDCELVKIGNQIKLDNSKPSYGCFLFTYCSECIVAFDDCKIKGIQQVVVEKEDLIQTKKILQDLLNAPISKKLNGVIIAGVKHIIKKIKKYIGGKEE